MPAVRFQLGLTGASGTDAAALTGQALAHTGQTGQQIFILGQLHLQAAFSGFCPLGENVQNQGAPVQNGHAEDFLQCPDMTGRQFIVKNSHGRRRGFDEHPNFLRLALADEAVGIGGMAVLDDFGSADAAGSFQQRFQFFQRFLGGCLVCLEYIGIQAHQHRTLYNVFFKIVFHSYLKLHFIPQNYYITISSHNNTNRAVFTRITTSTAPAQQFAAKSTKSPHCIAVRASHLTSGQNAC